MEILLLSFLIPALKSEWDIPEGFDGKRGLGDVSFDFGCSGLLGAVVFIGILVGNYLWGLVSDKYGRKVGFTALSSIVGKGYMFYVFSIDGGFRILWVD
jgi:MFS family permease